MEASQVFGWSELEFIGSNISIIVGKDHAAKRDKILSSNKHFINSVSFFKFSVEFIAFHTESEFFFYVVLSFEFEWQNLYLFK